MHGVQIPLDAADGQAPFFPQRGDAAERVDAQALAPQCCAVQLRGGHSVPPTHWAGPGDADVLGDLHRNHRQLDDFPSALGPAAGPVGAAIGTVLHHVLHPVGGCQARANADIHADGRPMSFFTDFDPVNREIFTVFDRDFQGL